VNPDPVIGFERRCPGSLPALFVGNDLGVGVSESERLSQRASSVSPPSLARGTASLAVLNLVRALARESEKTAQDHVYMYHET